MADQGTVHKLVIVRHGQSTWNAENKFTGWVDVDLTEQGVGEASRAGKLLKNAGFEFDVAYTSVLKRAIKTLNGILDELDQHFVPVVKDWRLNERHYGGLQGLNKSETAAKHGEDQVKIWRRSYDIPPPKMDESNEYYAGKDRRYANLTKEQIPLSESLKDTVARFLPYWKDVISKDVEAGKSVLIAAHGNSLRALVKHLESISDDEITGLDIPTGRPRVYELDENLKVLKAYYLGDQAELEAEMKAVAAQGKAQ